ncbi:hypothetical protein MTR67_012834 [Solanum verrucosum]|uniref:Uncharacterized protein n=1 Tax=Solanum verrucosum TaxID=315347 RepID=A0AAF0THU8_SOLVR|nr:hypothetical protein MTR67_012834 [Solanum verrucosum]
MRGSGSVEDAFLIKHLQSSYKRAYRTCTTFQICAMAFSLKCLHSYFSGRCIPDQALKMHFQRRYTTKYAQLHSEG